MQDIEHILKTRIEKDKADTLLVVVPTDAARVKRQRELVGYHPNRAVANLLVYTLGGFIQRLYNQISPTKLHISTGIQNLWLHEIANPQLDNPDAYRYDTFRPSQNVPVPDSTLSLIAETMNRLKEYGESAPNIGNGESQNPTEDNLARIYNDYETKLGDLWIDEQGKRLYLANDFNSQFMSRAFSKVDLVVVEGFTVLSQADIKILTRIAQMPQIEMWFRTDCVEENENLYKNIINLASQFSAVNANIDPDYEREPKRHQHYAENLFRTDNSSVCPIAASEIKVLKPADRSEEVEQVAHLIQKRVSEGHCKLSEICVACYNIGQYEQRIAEVFPTYDIPYSLVESAPLTKSEVVKAIFSQLSPRRTPLDGPYFSDIESVSQTKRFHPNEFQRYVDDLLKKGAVIQRILNPMLGGNSEVVEGEVEAYRQFERIVQELCGVLKSESEKLRPLDEYVEKLHHTAKHTNYQNRAMTKGETVKIIAQLSDLRSLEFNTVFLCDFVEGKFPENYRPDPLLPDHPYRNEEEHLYNNRFMFYGVLKSFRKRLYILVPQREREAELIPSPFLGQLKAIADIETTEVANPEQGSIPGFLSTYGEHVWESDTPSDREFPREIINMRSLIDHVVSVEKSREKTHEYLTHEGILTADSLSDESRDLLQSLRYESYSVTDLETYAKCPFQYFAARILGLGSKDEEDHEGLSGLEKGELVHEVLVKFYNKRREQPAINKCDEVGFEEAKQQLFDVINEVISDTTSEDLFRRVDKALLKVTLNQWLEVERKYNVTTTPSYFEASVGSRHGITDPVLSRPEPISIGNVQLNAKIDRIDTDNDIFNVIDYKSGSIIPGIKDILEGRALQLPIYLEIARQLFGTKYQPAAGLYYKVRLNDCKITLGIGQESYRGKAYILRQKTQQMLPDEEFDSVLTRVSGYLAQYVNGISNGTFPLINRVKTFSVSAGESEQPNCVETDEYGFVDSKEHGDKPLTPRNKTQPCSYCNYKRVCRVGVISESSQSDD